MSDLLNQKLKQKPSGELYIERHGKQLECMLAAPLSVSVVLQLNDPVANCRIAKCSSRCPLFNAFEKVDGHGKTAFAVALHCGASTVPYRFEQVESSELKIEE